MFCTKVKEYLSQRQVAFEDRDITRDPTAISELQKLGFMTTPVTVIGAKVIVGFDQVKLDEALTE
ncbi:MAG: NrdH-redoxin [Acidobacteria bacterium]|nr:MAG: NrdH-redoxin [Acidobacteriota bacterium]